ncbi:glycosyl transferase family protein [Alteromonas oceanisediminis]|uniref:glycosyl transferase family protein n=1 Tax=Alteromonas oceanisediminis TaxID=2836180 RepID=UPI001BDA7183|nr:glycosyl transferase family protein [Alteromonas oceanisediminis]MBT0586028.1 glycosyl transferase family protein [Alteromonas oceanisediminis]
MREFKQFIQLIGKGQRSGKTLSQAQAHRAMSLLLGQKVSAEQRGAFLMLLRMRQETPEELAGFLIASRAFTAPAFKTISVDLDLGCYAGKRRHLPWLLLAVLCLAGNGKRIVLHGANEPDSQRLYVADVLAHFNFPAAETAAQLSSQLDENSFGYVTLATINPRLDELLQLRAELGLRSCANTLSRMLNPLAAPVSIQGVYHRHLDEKHALVAQQLGEPNVLSFRGDSGEIELSPERECELHIARLGHRQTIAVPCLNQIRSAKPRDLEPDGLKALWEERVQDHYGHSAVVGTLAIMMTAMHSQSWQSAYSSAQKMWQQRDRAWPLRAKMTRHTDTAPVIAQPVAQY